MKKSITSIMGGNKSKKSSMDVSLIESSVDTVDKVSKNDIEDYVTKIHKSNSNELELVFGTPTVKKSEIDSYVDKNVKKSDDFLTAVNKPSHYQGITITGKNGSMEFEAIEIIDSVLEHLNFGPAVSHAIGDALKYILRCGKKDSDNNTTTDLKSKGKQDILKSSWYLKRAADVY